MKTLLGITGTLLLTVLFLGCSNSINNKVTIKNLCAGDIYVNFRGSVIDVASGQTSVISNIPKGKYDYSSSYSIPSGVTSASEKGNMTGTIAMNAGTKVELLYTSALLNGTYTVSISISNSDNQNASSRVTTTGKDAENSKHGLTEP